MSPAVSRALDPLRFRPLFWMALAALAGVATGGQWVASLRATSRADFTLLLPLIPALFCALLATICFRSGLRRRVGVAGLLFFLFVSASARRVTAPAGDISELTRLGTVPQGTLEPLPLKFIGVVADYPRISDFNIQFPVECEFPQRGGIWLTAPYDQKFQIGERVELIAELRPLPRPGNPGEPDTTWRYIGANCWCLGRRVVVSKRLGIAPGYSLAHQIGTWRGQLLRHYESQFRGGGDDASLRLRPFPATSAQLLTAMVFGEGGLARPLPGVVRDDFRAAGLSHVLVSSGTQVAFLAGIIMALVGKAVGKRWPLLLFLIPSLVLYALLAGGAASIWRATLGGVLLCCALLAGRDFDGLSVWGGAVLLLLWLDPALAWSLSFQLTFAATWGLLVFSPPLLRLLQTRFAKGYGVEATAFSVGAQVATLPISLLHFGSFSIVGLGVNFLVVPLATAMIITGLVGLVFQPLNWVNYFLTRIVASLAHIGAKWPGAYFEAMPISLSRSWLIYGLALLVIAPFAVDLEELKENIKITARKLWKKVVAVPTWQYAGGLFLFSLWVLWTQFGPGDSRLRVTMIDVGQGEAILIRSPSGQNVLIDGGSLENQPRSDIGAQVLVPTLQSLGVDRLDMVVLTHSDADHCNGLATVAKEIPIDLFLDGPSASQPKPNPTQIDYIRLRETLAEYGVPLAVPKKDQIFQLGETKLRLLGPETPALPGTNDNSIVARLDFGKTSFLLTGDIEEVAETRFLERGADLKCTVLKVPHHGSNGSSSAAFLQVAQPKVALVSCGRFNSFGHPGGKTLARLADRGAKVFRTDVSGAIEVACDGEACQVETYR